MSLLQSLLYIGITALSKYPYRAKQPYENQQINNLLLHSIYLI